MPGPKSIYHLWKTFDLNSNVGGACGEIAGMHLRCLLHPSTHCCREVYKGPKWKFMLNPLGKLSFRTSPQRAQGR
jgi:hypothetical protein